MSFPADHFLSDDLCRAMASDHKYWIIQRASGALFFLRHGEPWDAANNSDWIHTGMILAFAQEVAGLREQLAEAKDELSRIKFPDTMGR